MLVDYVSRHFQWDHDEKRISQDIPDKKKKKKKKNCMLTTTK